MGVPITNEKGEKFQAYKHNYALTGLKDIEGLRGAVYEEGPNSLNPIKKQPIENYVFDVIKLNQRGNEKFDFVDMFVRLNQNNCPLSIDSFEMWNSFDIVNTIHRIKEVAEYRLFRQQGKRMQEAELVTILAYIDYKNITIENLESLLSVELRTENKTKRNEITQIKISLQKHKRDITLLLEEMKPNSQEEKEFMKSVENVNNFADKLEMLSGDEEARLLDIFNPNTNRNALINKSDFYLIWLILKELDTHVILTYRQEILKDLESVFRLMKDLPEGKNEDDFINYVKSTINKYSKYCKMNML